MILFYCSNSTLLSHSNTYQSLKLYGHKLTVHIAVYSIVIAQNIQYFLTEDTPFCGSCNNLIFVMQTFYRLCKINNDWWIHLMNLLCLSHHSTDKNKIETKWMRSHMFTVKANNHNFTSCKRNCKWNRWFYEANDLLPTLCKGYCAGGNLLSYSLPWILWLPSCSGVCVQSMHMHNISHT